MLAKPTSNRIIKPGGAFAKKSEYESYTSLSLYRECPVLYYDHYTKHKKEPVSKELIFGRAWHGLCEDALREKEWHGRDMSLRELLGRWHYRWIYELESARDAMEWEGAQSPEDFFKAGRKLVVTWRAMWLPRYNPLAIEEPFFIKVTGCKRAITGKLDLITSDGFVIDHKTSGYTWRELIKNGRVNPKERDLQMSIYHAAYSDLQGRMPRGVMLHRAIIGRNTVEEVDLTYTLDQVQADIDTIVRPTIKAIEESYETGSFKCTCKKHKDVAVNASA